MVLCIIKDNYVINRIKIAPEDFEDYTYPGDHDLIIEDVDMIIHIGDWWEVAESKFYRPIGGTPEDSPLYEPPIED
jgi:hypothetical protein